MKRLLAAMLCMLLILPAYAEAPAALLYTPPVNLRQSALCRAFVEGVELKLIDATVNHQRTWAANPVLLGKAPIGIFDVSGTVNIELRFPEALTELLVRPLSLNIRPVIQGNSAFFTLSNPAQLTVEWNGDSRNALHLFAHAPDPYTALKGQDRVLYFGPGLHHVGVLEPESGQTVYLAGGAVLRGAIHIVDKQDVKVLGRGIITGQGYERWTDVLVPLTINNSSRVLVEGITLIEPAAWCMNLYHSRDVVIRDCAIIGWCSNSDGISVQSCETVLVENCFLRTWDDSLVVKGYEGDCRNISFRNCRLWTDLAQSCEVGYETRAQVIQNILFEDITVLHSFHKAPMSVHNSDHALVRNVVFRDIVVEDAQMGQGDGQPLLIELTTTKSGWSKTAERGQIRDVRFENISVLAGRESSIRIFSFSRDKNVDGVSFQNLNILGRQIRSLDELKMNVNSRNGADIRLVGAETPVQAKAVHPGYLHTARKKPTTVKQAGGVSATASSHVENYLAENAVDGKLLSYWEGAGGGEDLLTLRFDSPRDLSQLRLLLNPAAVWGRRSQRIAILVSRDGQNYEQLLPAQEYVFDPAGGNEALIPLQAAGVLALRLQFLHNTGAKGGQLAEVLVE